MDIECHPYLLPTCRTKINTTSPFISENLNNKEENDDLNL